MAQQRTRVKICGLTRAEDVQAACALGADAVGFVCYRPSPRFVEPERLAALAAALAPLVGLDGAVLRARRREKFLEMGRDGLG